jgi:hypothetical protein
MDERIQKTIKFINIFSTSFCAVQPFTAAFLSVARYKKRDLYHDFCHNKSLAFSLDTDAFASADGFKPTFRCFATPFLLIEEGISFLFPPVKSRADKLRIPS